MMSRNLAGGAVWTGEHAINSCAWECSGGKTGRVVVQFSIDNGWFCSVKRD